jgi:hypothetical protein
MKMLLYQRCQILLVKSTEAEVLSYEQSASFLSFFLLSYTTPDRGNVLALSEREKNGASVGSESIRLIGGDLILQTT